MKKFSLLLALSLLLGCHLSDQAMAAPTDIVPRGSALLDAFATLAQAGALGVSDTPESFLGDSLYTREQLAKRLEHLVQDEPATLTRVQEEDKPNTALQAALAQLAPELDADGVDTSGLDAPPAGASVSGYLQPEIRLRTGGDRDPGSGGIGVYRITAQGNLRSNLRFALSVSNWPEDSRRVFHNDVGPHDFSALNEAYLEINGGRGLTVSLGRMNNRWGPGYRGATLISDNAPAFDQLHVAFPFSLGSHLGRDYRFSQFAATFTEVGTRKYLEGRRIEYAFNHRLTADFQEAFKSSRAKSLEVTLLPDFYNSQSANSHLAGLRVNGLDQSFNSFLNFGLAYALTPDARLYGQFGIDDIQTPGHQSYRTPRKIAYLVGGAFHPLPQTEVVAEYTFADPTTYSSRIPATQWGKGLYNEIGLPTGPNSREYFLRLSRRLTPRLTGVVEGRDRRRRRDSFPAPNSRDLALSLDYAPDKRSGFQVTYQDYRQDAFPLAPTVPVPGDGFTPANAEGFYGQALRLRQLDIQYRFFF